MTSQQVGQLGDRLICSSIALLDNEVARTSDPSYSCLLKRCRDALGLDDLKAALRLIDAVWRRIPSRARQVASIYGRLLVLDGNEFEAAARSLGYALAQDPDPDIEALIAVCYCGLGQVERATEKLDECLRRYCVEPNGILYLAAGAIVSHQENQEIAGWIGVDARLNLIGEAVGSASEIAIQSDTPVSFTTLPPYWSNPPARAFTINGAVPKDLVTARATVGDRRLIGSGGPAADYGLDGRSDSHGDFLVGWAHLAWCPARPLRLQATDEFGNQTLFSTGTPRQA